MSHSSSVHGSGPGQIRRLVVLDGNAAWVRALFAAMSGEIDVRLIHIGNPGMLKKGPGSWLKARRWQRCGTNAQERWIIVPSWTKAAGTSSWLARRAVATAAKLKAADGTRIDPHEVAVVFALPQYAGVAETTDVRPRIYYAQDPFEFYSWDREKILALEDRMLKATEMTVAISRLLRDDLAGRSGRPVLYSPNAVSADFVTKLAAVSSELPADLTGIARPIVGCTGQINETYDWAMLAELTTKMADVSFVFIGPIMPVSGEVQKRMDGVLKGRPNVHWFDRKPHDQLPRYLRAFAVCLCPLTPNPAADRRSPLRLFDYLATGKPVVSTAIHEARSHENQVLIGKGAAEIESLLRQALAGQTPVNVGQRMNYVTRNTWEARAKSVLEMIRR